MAYRHMRYPEGKTKAVTFSYDDGVRFDIRLAEICNRYGIKCTFNINSAFIAQEEGGRKLTAAEIQRYILDAGHEVAIHGHEHKAPGLCTPPEIVQDELNCRLELERIFGRIIRGMAYPDSGIRNLAVTPYPVIRQILIDLGIAYSRTLGDDNNGFGLPEDWYAWMPTAHHQNPNALNWAKEFVELDLVNGYASRLFPRLFYLWGHSYEFDNNDNWELLEQLCATLGGHDDCWYATNIEIYDYVQAYRALQFSADGKTVYNPTLQKVWFAVDKTLYSVGSGETLTL